MSRGEVGVGASVAAVVIGTFAGSAAAVALQAWLAMLLMGGIHHSVSESVPALGFGPVVLAVLALNLIAGFFRR